MAGCIRNPLWAASLASLWLGLCAGTWPTALRNDSRAAALMIEEYLRKCGGCVATPLIRTLLAEAYLLQAAQIAPVPAKANAKLFREAEEALGGDLTPLARRAAARPNLVPIIPFLQGNVDHKVIDENGETVICSAVSALNADLVKEELNGGADPNGSCEQTSLLMLVLYKATNAHVPERQSIVRVLLQRGARDEGIKFCESRDNGDCSAVLLPILKEFDDERARSRRSL